MASGTGFSTDCGVGVGVGRRQEAELRRVSLEAQFLPRSGPGGADPGLGDTQVPSAQRRSHDSGSKRDCGRAYLMQFTRPRGRAGSGEELGQSFLWERRRMVSQNNLDVKGPEVVGPQTKREGRTHGSCGGHGRAGAGLDAGLGNVGTSTNRF